MNRAAVAMAAMLIVAVIALIFITSEPPPPARKRVRVAGKPQATSEPEFEFVQSRKRGS